MCGIFGFVGNKPNINYLKKLALGNSERGSDACGLYYNTPNSLGDDLNLVIEKRAGSFEQNLSLLDGGYYAQRIIGHARLASMPGDPTDLRNAQPIRYGSVILAHNGNVYRHKEWAKAMDLRLRTECDSEVIAQIIAHDTEQRSAFNRVRDAILLLELSNYALIVCVEGVMYVACSGQPLYFAELPEGNYFSSVPFTVPYQRRRYGRLGDNFLFTGHELKTFERLEPKTAAHSPVW